MGGQSAIQLADRVVAKAADAQYGVVARRQLLARGLTSKEVEGRVRAGLLIPLHRGVYAVGHRRLTQDGIWLAAVLAAGPGAVLSHRDAGALHGLGRWSVGRIEVTSPGRARSTARLRVFERRALDAGDATVVERIPVTSVGRTLVDLADVLSQDRLARAVTEAERANALDVSAVEAALARVGGRRSRGPAALRAVLAEHARNGAQLTRSELERALRRLVRAHGLPRPRLNAIAGGEEVDALWAAQRVVVEADGWAFHRDRGAFGRDRAKTNRLTLAGFTVLRFTHDDVVRRPAATAEAIRRALG